MTDVWATFTKLDTVMRERLADVLETRGSDLQQQARCRVFLADISLPANAHVPGVRYLPLYVSTNQLPVTDVLFSERSLQRVLFSKNLPVDDPSHERKRCDHPRISRDQRASKIEQGPAYIHRVATYSVRPAGDERRGPLQVDIGGYSHRRC